MSSSIVTGLFRPTSAATAVAIAPMRNANSKPLPQYRQCDLVHRIRQGGDAVHGNCFTRFCDAHNRAGLLRCEVQRVQCGDQLAVGRPEAIALPKSGPRAKPGSRTRFVVALPIPARDLSTVFTDTSEIDQMVRAQPMPMKLAPNRSPSGTGT